MEEFNKEEIQAIVDKGERKATTAEVELLYRLMTVGSNKKICMCKKTKYFQYANKWLSRID